jgi:paraquat-inducible protein A
MFTMEYDGGICACYSCLHRQVGQNGEDHTRRLVICPAGAYLCFSRHDSGNGFSRALAKVEKTAMIPMQVTNHPLPVISCSSCHLLCRQPFSGNAPVTDCPRCGARLYHRKPNSLSRTWALTLAAFIFYLPANLFPISHMSQLGTVQSDTIISGVIYFIKPGMWPIALVIFVASVLIPLLKLITLVFLLISVQRHSRWRPRDRTRLYRITEAIGRWSMIDIFVITILVALIELGAVADIDAGPAALFFAVVVIITMMAAMSFDPRLIWDTQEPSHDRL